MKPIKVRIIKQPNFHVWYHNLLGYEFNVNKVKPKYNRSLIYQLAGNQPICIQPEHAVVVNTENTETKSIKRPTYYVYESKKDQEVGGWFVLSRENEESPIVCQTVTRSQARMIAKALNNMEYTNN